jgi:tetratricopeptide (TPR) repeat protein
MEFEEFDIEFLAQKMSENPQSPLFARLADLYLGKQQTVEALKLSEEGIKFFPNYYAGYIVLGKAHLELKEFSKAISAFEKASELSPFNQTVAKLLKSVPNTSDESVRTTEENYFTEPSLSVEENSFNEPAAQSEPVQEPFEQDRSALYGIQENTYSSGAEEFSGSIYDQPILHTPSDQQNNYKQTSSIEPFPSFDEYFAENQLRIGGDAEKKLDDYLNEAPSDQNVTLSRDIDPSIFTNTTFETTSTAPEPHFDPEPVFSSPEQEQLFAELTGEEYHPQEASSQQSDLDSLAAKLQSAEKIIPQENYQPKTPLPDTTKDEEVYETDAVTPTLAEIYASQGEFRAAIQAYEILMFSVPAKGGEYQQRIRELQQLQMEKDGLI